MFEMCWNEFFIISNILFPEQVLFCLLEHLKGHFLHKTLFLLEKLNPLLNPLTARWIFKLFFFSSSASQIKFCSPSLVWGDDRKQNWTNKTETLQFQPKKPFKFDIWNSELPLSLDFISSSVRFNPSDLIRQFTEPKFLQDNVHFDHWPIRRRPARVFISCLKSLNIQICSDSQTLKYQNEAADRGKVNH